MAGGWRTTARMMATAAAAAAVTRAAESIRRLVDEAGRPELDGPVSTPGQPRFLEPPTRLTTAGPQVTPQTEDHIIAAQVHPPHEFGPAPVVVPSRGIGFRPEPRTPQPVAEMPIISRPFNREPERPAPVPTYVPPPPPPVHTAASIVEDLDEETDVDDGTEVEDGTEVDADVLADGAAAVDEPEPAAQDLDLEAEADDAVEDDVEVDSTVGEDHPVEVPGPNAPPVGEATATADDVPVLSVHPTDERAPGDDVADGVADVVAEGPTEADLARSAALEEARRARKKAKKAKRRAKELRAKEREAQALEDQEAADRAIAAHEAAELARASTATGAEEAPLVVEEPHVEIIVAEHLAASDPVTQEFIAPEPVLAGPVDTQGGTGRHRRDHSAISGTVRSTRGRGLRGILVEAYDTAETLVASATSGAGGVFIVEDLPAGVYRLRASDADGDFATRWLGGSSFDMASPLRLKDRKTRRKTDLQLLSTAGIDVSVDVRKKKTRVAILVTERGTGITASGAVRVSTKHFSTELPLVDGESAITLLGPATSGKGSRTIGKKVQVRYRGDRHTAPGSHTTTLR